MPLLLILIILLSIYIIKSDNIKNAIKKDIQKISLDKQYNQNSQTDLNAKNIITDIRTSFLEILETLKIYYYKLKKTTQKYFKGVNIDRNIKNSEKLYADAPKYNHQHPHQHNNEPIQFNINNFNIEDKVMSKSSYILAAIISLCGSILFYYFCYFLLMLIVNSYSKSEVIYYVHMYGNAYGYSIIIVFEKIVNVIYKVVNGLCIVAVILSTYFYKKNNTDESRKIFWIMIIVAIGIFLGTLIFNHLLRNGMIL